MRPGGAKRDLPGTEQPVARGVRTAGAMLLAYWLGRKVYRHFGPNVPR
jgi:hypothetical protein